jgi:hypothetical protein
MQPLEEGPHRIHRITLHLHLPVLQLLCSRTCNRLTLLEIKLSESYWDAAYANNGIDIILTAAVIVFIAINWIFKV